MSRRQDDPLYHPVWGPGIMLLLLAPVLLLFVYFGLADQTFRLLGRSTSGATILLAASLFGSLVNIPLTRKQIVLADRGSSSLPPALQWLAPYLHYHPPRVMEQAVALNVGGAVVPVVFSLHLLTLSRTSVPATLCVTAAMTPIVHVLARRVPGEGVTMPMFVPPLVAAVAARDFANAFGVPAGDAAPVAYIAGTLGTLIGADLLNLPATLRGDLVPDDAETSGRVMDSIGGAGVFDGIFLTGILAPMLATL